MATPKFDEVHYWTEIKLEIIRKYAERYVTILSKQSAIKHYAYIDGFAGTGKHISKRTGKEIQGSPAIALDYAFDHYHFIDLDGERVAYLRSLAKGRSDISVYEGDCNDVLPDEVFPKCLYKHHRRALCLLDPYQLNPNWEVVCKAGRMQSIDIFLNFMIMDLNRNILRSNPEDVSEAQIARVNAFWGDDSWREAAYTRTPGLFGEMTEKNRNEAIVMAYKKRLKEVAGFKYVPDPLPMRNRSNAVVYYLFFASNKEAGYKIAHHLFKKYQDMGAQDGH